MSASGGAPVRLYATCGRIYAQSSALGAQPVLLGVAGAQSSSSSTTTTVVSRGAADSTRFYVSSITGTIQATEVQVPFNSTALASSLASNSAGEITLSPDGTEELFVLLDVTISEK